MNEVVLVGSKPVRWVGASKKEIQKLPKEVRQVFGQAIYDAQIGKKHPGAKPLKGFSGAGVLEVIEDELGSTYRAVYTVKFADIVYVLSVFQKKSKSGRKTPKEEIDKIKSRFQEAEKDYAKYIEQRKESAS